MRRDPRIDPKPGDVLRCDPLVFTVSLTGKRVHYTLTQPGAGVSAIPMQCTLRLKEWRKIMAETEVIEWGEV